MFLVGVTGGIGSGKSTVSAIFKSLGFPVVDADEISRKVVEPGKRAWKKIKKEFGDSILLDDGTLNREKLAEIIFTDRAKRRRLNEITHPDIVWSMMKEAIYLGLLGHSCVMMDIPLLYESGELVKFMHKIIVVRCDGDQQVSRLLLRTKMTKTQAEQRVSAQMPLDQKAERADFVIDNTGSQDQTVQQVHRLAAYLRRSRFHWKIRTLAFGFTLIAAAALIIVLRLAYSLLQSYYFNSDSR